MTGVAEPAGLLGRRKVVVPSRLIKVATRIGATGFASVAQAVMLLHLAAAVGAGGYGAFGQLLSIGYFTAGVLNFGMAARALRSATEAEARQLRSSLLAARAVFGGMVGLVIIGSGVAIGVRPILTAGAALFLFSEMVSELLQALYAGRGSQHIASLLFLAQRLAGAAIALLCTIAFGPATAFLLAQCVVAIVVALACVPFIGRVRLGLLRKHAAGFWFASLAANIYQLDAVVAVGAGGHSVGGVVASGSRLNGPFNLVTAALLTVFLPDLARTQEGEKRRHLERRLLRFGSAYALTLFVAAPVVALGLVHLLGPSFASGTPYYWALVVGAGLSGLAQVLQAFLYANNEPGIAGVTVTAGALGGLVALAVGISVAGVYGAAAGPLVANALIVVGFLVHRRVRRRRREIPRSHAAASSASPAGYFAVESRLPPE